MILIYSKDVDDFVNNVMDCLDEDFVRIGESDKVSIEAMDFSNEKSSYVLKTGYLENIELEKIQSIWFNGGCINSGGSDYENKCYEVLNDAFMLQKSIKKIGKRIADFETNRLDIMLEAKEQGLKIPHTLITGSKEKLLAFYDIFANKNGIVSKRILDTLYYQDDDYLYNFNLTFLITPEILQKTSTEFAISFFQERIIADFEIRVIYIDGNFYSIAIHIFDDTIDYRTKFIEMDNIRIVPFKLPINIEEKLDKVFKKFHLNYGSADLMYCNGDYYFLEINPTGQVSFMNNTCNYYLENKLAEILKNGKQKTNQYF
ncbi:hypothetical protein [Flavobacterium pectinovorum]|uniref:Grasp-with-spasm system ATP-grasp peptide maturase n=1 Tax=Flavobacterium pectinovorum TaxID=29533 RepID=A0A502EZA2_9FLAO|nr:hypothetical protein [Flavobacterium pectinovorum]TPG42019.1 hypothetical protein EAH81_06755 [Flavobacterium pectinovorum]